MVGLALAVPLSALALTERRAQRVRRLLRLRRPDRAAVIAPALALALLGSLVAAAAAQPVLVVRDQQLVRRDAEVFVAIDTSRSMLAAEGAGEPTRFDRATRLAADLRRRFADVPIGLASLTDRLLLHLFPTTDAAAYTATLQRAMAVDRPPPRLASKRATRLSASGEVAVWNYFSETAKDRIAVVLTDGEGQPSDPRDLRAALRDGVRVQFVFVQVWRPEERVFGPAGAEAGYAADPASFPLLQRVAAVVRAPAYRESEIDRLEAELRRRLPAAKPTDVGSREKPRPLAPWAAAAAFLPLAFLLRLRNRA